jgi:glycogen debranching enzyme
MTEVRAAHPIEILHGHGTALACDREGRVIANEQHGLFAADTRVLSTYRISIGGQPWQPLSRHREGHGTASWQFQNAFFRESSGGVPEGTLLLDIRRRIAGAMHDDLLIRAFPDHPIRTSLVVQLDTDFADIFEVKAQSIPPRPRVGRVARDARIILKYERGRFRRRCHICLKSGTAPEFAGTLVVFDLILDHGAEWRCCLDVEPEIDGEIVPFVGDPHERERPPALQSPTEVIASPVLADAFDRGRADVASLSLPHQHDEHGEPVVAAGAPWFLTLFGRDPLVAGLMTGLLGTWVTEGALQAVGEHQATERDDRRDAEPGKLPHELRRGELAHRGAIPHTPYFGTHDAPALYCLALWNAWRWTGEDALLEQHLETARRALKWCDEIGDRDGDGFLEYATRSPQGYYNQGWKDAGDAIVHEDGGLARLPIATVELQGYLFAARHAMAELLERVGENDEAERLRAAAADLRDLVEDRFWMDDIGFYALALDGEKRPVRSIASNAGHLLWTGLPHRDRARRVAERLLEPDMFSGWGMRTLSSNHPAYNPLSYQRGSVWPHDTALAGAGMARYGLHNESWALARSLLDAAGSFEDNRLPELFCGFDRSAGIPIPYREANVPQAWAAAAPALIVQVLLGLVPDVPRGRWYVAPHLPDWLQWLEVRGISSAEGTVDLRVESSPTGVSLRATGDAVEVHQVSVNAPLWGDPPP